MAPFHQKMTALLDARSCEVPPPDFFRSDLPTQTPDTQLPRRTPDRESVTVGDLPLEVSA
jgi:hypothetical protein